MVYEGLKSVMHSIADGNVYLSVRLSYNLFFPPYTTKSRLNLSALGGTKKSFYKKKSMVTLAASGRERKVARPV